MVERRWLKGCTGDGWQNNRAWLIATGRRRLDGTIRSLSKNRDTLSIAAASLGLRQATYAGSSKLVELDSKPLPLITSEREREREREREKIFAFEREQESKHTLTKHKRLLATMLDSHGACACARVWHTLSKPSR